MVSLRALIVSCDRKHVIAIYVQKINMPLKCHISHICQHVHL